MPQLSLQFISETELEEIKSSKGLRPEDGTIAADKPLAEVRPGPGRLLIALCVLAQFVPAGVNTGWLLCWLPVRCRAATSPPCSLCCLVAAAAEVDAARVRHEAPRALSAGSSFPTRAAWPSPSPQVLREAKEAKEAAFQDQWKLMKQVKICGFVYSTSCAAAASAGLAPVPHVSSS